MPRKGLTAVEKTKLEALARRAGLNVISKRGWTKCYLPGQDKGKAIGIPNTEKVTRVEIVGFTSPLGIKHPKPPANTVEQMLNFEQAEALILENFKDLCRELMAMAPAEGQAAPKGEQQVITAGDVGEVPPEVLTEAQLEALTAPDSSPAEATASAPEAPAEEELESLDDLDDLDDEEEGEEEQIAHG